MTPFRREVLRRLAEATEPLELGGAELRAARWLTKHGFAVETDGRFSADAGPEEEVAAELGRPHVRGPDIREPARRGLPGRWEVRFGAGEATIVFDPSARIYEWTARSASGESFGESAYWGLAMLAAWSATAVHELPPRIKMEADELEGLIERARSTVGAVAILRHLLERRTGFRWSVRRGKGKWQEHIYIKAANPRLLGTSMTGHDAALLGALLGRTAVNLHHGATIAPSLGGPAAAVRAISGWFGIEGSSQRPIQWTEARR